MSTMSVSEYKSLLKKLYDICANRKNPNQQIDGQLVLDFVKNNPSDYTTPAKKNFIQACQGRALIDKILAIRDVPNVQLVYESDLIPSGFTYNNIVAVINNIDEIDNDPLYSGRQISCRGACVGLCINDCFNVCDSDCENACYNYCTNSEQIGIDLENCNNDCAAMCRDNCKDNCKTGCRAGCSDACSGRCGNNCSGECYGTSTDLIIS